MTRSSIGCSAPGLYHCVYRLSSPPVFSDVRYGSYYGVGTQRL